MRDILRRLLPGSVMLLGISLVIAVAWLATAVVDGGTSGPVARREVPEVAETSDRLPSSVSMPGLVVETNPGAGVAHAMPPWDEPEPRALDRHPEEPDFGSRHLFVFEPPDLPPALSLPAFDATVVRPQHPRPTLVAKPPAIPWQSQLTQSQSAPADPGPAAIGPRWPTYVSRARSDTPDWRGVVFRGN